MSKLEQQQQLVGKYRNYSTYSNSGVDWVGEMPAVWTLKRVKHMFTIRKRIAGELGYDILSVTQRGIVVKDIESGEGQLSMDYSKYQRVKLGDFAMNHMDLLTGYVDISDYDGVTSPDYRVFTLDNTDYSAKYFLYIFQMGYQLRLFFHMGQGASHLGRWRLGTDEFNEMVFPVPSCEEQRTIAAFLDYETARIDQLIAKQQQLIELLKEKRQAVISHAVTKGLNPNAPMKDSGIEWLGQVPEHWIHNFKLGAVAEQNRGSFVNGPFGSDLLSNELTQEGVPVIYIRDVKPSGYYRKSTDCVTPKKAKQLNVCKVEPGDVLVAKVGSPPGEACIYPNSEPEAIITQDVVRIRVNKQLCDAYYLSCLLNSTYGKAIVDDISVESTRKRFGLGDYKQLKIPLPPLDEQIQLASWIRDQCDKLDMLNTKAKCTIDLMQERRIALISAAVTGKIDLRGWTPPSDNEVTA